MQKFSLMRLCFSLLEVKATGDQMKCTITLKKDYRFLKGVVIFLLFNAEILHIISLNVHSLQWKKMLTICEIW